MANLKSSLKDIKRNAKRRLRNRSAKAAMKTFIKKAKAAAATGDVEVIKQALAQACSAIDKTAERGIIHKNQAARRKSRLMRYVNQILAQASSGA
ncbi:MAG: 30S ribosomal protein S20 [Chthonomonadetes bacterium]|nr:30S ribosomal protein S20 [Chthonomonadetes bacterium]